MGLWSDTPAPTDLSRLGRLHAVCSSGGGVPKTSINSAIVSLLGLNDDAHTDLVHHGGPDRAVCVFSLEIIEALAREGHPVVPGSTGENLTVAGLPWAEVTPGAILEIGEVALEITSYTSPCRTIRESFLEGNFNRINQKKHPGWSRVYARVLRTGTVRSGEPVSLRPGPELAPLL